MNFMARIGVTGLLAAVAINAWAAGSSPNSSKTKFNVTGTWQATGEAARGPAQNLTFVLKQDGDKLSGTASTNGGTPVEITGARILRTTIYFEVVASMPAMPGGAGGPGQRGAQGMPGMPMTLRFTGTPSGDEMKLTSQMKTAAMDGDSPTGGGGRKTNLVAKRQ